MNKGHKEYQIFQKICRTLGIEEKVLAAKINAKGTEDIVITTHDRNTDMSYILNVIGKGSGHEFFMELFEAHEDGENGEKKIILKGHVMTRPPPIRRRAAVTAIMGVILLIAIGAGGAGFFYVALESQLEQDAFIDVQSFTLTPVNQDFTQFLLKMAVLSSANNLEFSSPVFNGTYVLLPAGEFETRQDEDAIDPDVTDVDGCVSDSRPTERTCVLEGQSGYLITYEGIITLDACTGDGCPREQIQVEFAQEPPGISTIESFEVPN